MISMQASAASSQKMPTPTHGALENLTIIQPHPIVTAATQLQDRRFF